MRESAQRQAQEAFGEMAAPMSPLKRTLTWPKLKSPAGWVSCLG